MERMNYLRQYTSGEANEIVKGYSYLNASRGYAAAIRELDQRYGNNELIATEYIKKTRNWPKIKADDIKGLDRYSIFLTECEYAVTNIESMQILDYSENMKMLVSKLPYHMHDKWRRIATKSTVVRFSQLVKFVREEAVSMNHPVYGRIAMNAGHLLR
ncbi:uncharacterized protein LOC102806147 [Saccoglossus kowalevskii]|uniref:Uncharacterized protein LOC102806147 n=1 Tax=Saccoglossus kowalevskii TaxID=10224 RepID=A0ABM0LY82_SACKO|nr:PREDICTED: uncharacterized protein LOC102806147 [Saccoglossus kowalevskii]